MKGIIFYYSSSGNTKLACQYIGNNLSNVDIELFNMVKADTIPELSEYDMVGFACFADFFGPSYVVEKFIEELPQQKDKLAFVFNTFGNITGKTLLSLARLVESKGFNVVSGYSLKTPQTYVPQIARNRGAEDEPSADKMEKLNDFIQELKDITDSYQKGEKIRKGKLRVGLAGRIMPSFSRERARKDMGDKFVDETACEECGICEMGCPYGAIELNPKPQFDMSKCYGCWSCYHHCPNQAIYTEKYQGIGHYPKPNGQMKQKLGV